jgi:hypothetical protein
MSQKLVLALVLLPWLALTLGKTTKESKFVQNISGSFLATQDQALTVRSLFCNKK